MYIQEIKSFGFTINFDVIRNVMYKYSEQTRDEFLYTSFLPVLLIHFASNSESIEYISAKGSNSKH